MLPARPLLLAPVPLHYFCNNVLRTQVRGIDVHRIRRGDQRRDTPRRVALVALCQVTEKGAQGSMDSFVDQLLMPSAGAFLETRGQEHLERRVGEYDASHVAPFGNEARRLPEGALAGKERSPHFWKLGHFGSAVAAVLVANCVRYVLSREDDPIAAKLGRETCGERGKASLIAGRYAVLQAGQRDQAVQRAALKVMKAERLRDALRDRALARGGRAVDCDD